MKKGLFLLKKTLELLINPEDYIIQNVIYIYCFTYCILF